MNRAPTLVEVVGGRLAASARADYTAPRYSTWQ
jgi:hypothetical protein